MTKPITSNASAPVAQTPLHAMHGEILEKFNGVNFKRWHYEMLINLIAPETWVEAPILKEGKPNNTEVASVDAWKYSDFLCKSYILNGLDNTLYVHSPIKIAKQLEESLEKSTKSMMPTRKNL